jgi:uncharacterized iron-regulated protein
MRHHTASYCLVGPTLVALTLAGLSACHPTSRTAEARAVSRASASLLFPPFVGTHDRSHPLVGRIWQPKTSAFSSAEQLLNQALRARFVLLGETHDDADHHALQATIYAALLAHARRPSLVLEMIDEDSQSLVDDAVARFPRDVDAIARAVSWQSSGWPAWSMYAPIVAVARNAPLPIVAGNAPHQEMRSLVKKGVESLAAGREERLLLGRAMDDTLLASLKQELVDAHCGMLPAGSKVIDGMVLAERARDASMARHLLETGGDGAVLIAGSGHARIDRGVPWALRELDPKATTFSVGFIEVDPALTEPSAYASRYGVAKLPFDMVVFTPSPDRADPCEGMRAK